MPTSLPMLGWGRGGLWTSAGLSSTQDGGSRPGSLFESPPGEVLEELGRVLKGSGLSPGLRSAWARAGFRESRWAGGARIWVHLASERMGLSVSSGGRKKTDQYMDLMIHYFINSSKKSLHLTNSGFASHCIIFHIFFTYKASIEVSNER